MIPSIRPDELQKLITSGAMLDLIDVRSPEEFAEVHALGARLIPLDDLDPKALASSADRPLYLICHSGGRSALACQILKAAGIRNVVNVTGGTAAWVEAGLPIKTKRKPTRGCCCG